MAAKRSTPASATAKKAGKKAAARPAKAGARKAPAKKTAARKAARPAAPKPGAASKAKLAPRAKAPAAVRPPKARRLGAAETRKYREALLAKRRDLLAAYLSAKGDSRNRTQDGTEDYIDYAVSSYDREFLLSLTELDQQHLLLVEDALRRLDRGEFGRCAQCQTEIPPKRLEVQPWARYCLRCQELDEQGLLVREERETDMDEESVEREDPETEDAVEVDDDLDEDDDSLDSDGLLGS